ncbi:hypothetical protein DQ04_10911010 [Trypanosoma grayi]|uniref:hypothetical protein n=1 Tax=Trypanosoma grayi TaxID=71804 RepID=UPI0004F42982|nr:hypothetical protein DQ04_10911010 [Trypanosoma grayi]KEG07100.1 hypothetical protein DQ04_10911010 [Trypanosoma grayi]
MLQEVQRVVEKRKGTNVSVAKAETTAISAMTRVTEAHEHAKAEEDITHEAMGAVLSAESSAYSAHQFVSEATQLDVTNDGVFERVQKNVYDALQVATKGIKKTSDALTKAKLALNAAKVMSENADTAYRAATSLHEFAQAAEGISTVKEAEANGDEALSSPLVGGESDVAAHPKAQSDQRTVSPSADVRDDDPLARNTGNRRAASAPPTGTTGEEPTVEQGRPMTTSLKQADIHNTASDSTKEKVKGAAKSAANDGEAEKEVVSIDAASTQQSTESEAEGRAGCRRTAR